MCADRIIINASPLILLFNSDLSFILPELFEEILVPAAVADEIMCSSYRFDKAVQMLPVTKWIQKVSVKNIEEVIRWDLGKGETDVLSFAFQNPAYKPVLDDMAAKKCSTALGIQTIGTGSVLVLAKKKRIIDSVEKALIKLRNSGMWISDAVIQLLKESAGE